LVYAVSLIGNEKIAVDCGCGAGSDIAYLRNEGFTVYAFDIEEASIKICTLVAADATLAQHFPL
jgi:2-polyprenyl-3-methyl-5-hydroxy-6-metoxy-1,4-benzoquinol methylase